jgi:hypothetical protein
VDFDDQSIWLNQNEWQNWDKNRLKDFISTVNSSGGTDVGGGLNAMKHALVQTSSESIPGYVILLTDGLGKYSNEADWFALNGIKIYTVSYKDKADAKLMSHIASTTNGLYIQADDENDVITAFSQFLDDVKGYNKYQSYYGKFGGKNVCELPHFFVDDKSSLLTGKLNWKTDPLDLMITSPSGIVYSYKPQVTLNTIPDFISYEDDHNMLISNGGPYVSFDLNENFIPETKTGNKIEWIKGESYMIVKIQNPEGGEWKSKVITSNGTNSDDSFLFEASGSSDLVLKLSEKNIGSTFNYSISEESKSINLINSKAEINLTSPKGKSIDISPNYRNGSFSFYPMDGIGNYKISATIHFSNLNGNPLQRYFVRSKLVGEVLPGYIAPVKETMGTYVITEQGITTGNRPGIKCIIFAAGNSSSSPKATGFVTHVNQKECTIRITDMRSGKIEKGDIVELDMAQWQNDIK